MKQRIHTLSTACIFWAAMVALQFFALQAKAWNNGDQFTREDITYKVLSADNWELAAIGCTKTGAVSIPAEVEDGKDQKFKVVQVGGEGLSWSGVTEVTVPEGVHTMENYALMCNTIKKIILPSTLQTFREVANALWGCDGLEEIVISKDNPYMTVVNNCLYDKNVETLYHVPSKCEAQKGIFTVPNTVKKIYLGAFNDCHDMTRLELPASLEDIHEAVDPTILQNCNALTYINVAEGNSKFKNDENGVLFTKDGYTLLIYPAGKQDETYTVPHKDGFKVNYLAGGALQGVGALKSINLNKVETTGVKSINGCGMLEKITIPATLENIAEGSFTYNNNLTAYEVESGNTTYMADDGILYTADKATLLFCPTAKTGDYRLLDGVKVVAQQAFQGTHLSKVTIPPSIEELGFEAFRGSPDYKVHGYGLQEVIIEDTDEKRSNLQTIGKGCFESDHISEITLPRSLETIKWAAFNDCDDLTTVIIPDGSQLKIIENIAFNGCDNLKTFDIQGACTLETIEHNAFTNDPKLEAIKIPASVKFIGDNAFLGNTNLKTVTFEDTAEKPSQLTFIGQGVFADCGLEGVVLPASVETIGKESFRNCQSLQSIHLSKNAKSIDPEAFKFCNNLKSITVDKENETYSSVDGILLSQDKKTLVLFPGGKAYDKFTLLPPSITAIGNYAFYNCVNLKNVTIPNKVESIGARAFGLCTQLNTVTFLCDEMIDPAKIKSGDGNTMSFDEGLNGTNDIRETLNVYVRKEKVADYEGKDFYNNFKKGIKTSFFAKSGEQVSDEEAAAGNYTEEYIPVSDIAVDLLSTKSTDWTYVIPQTVKDAQGKEYAVSLIGDYAFQYAQQDIHEVVVKNNIEYIGAKAFKTKITENDNTLTADESSIESVFLIPANPTKEMLSSARFELDETGTDYSEFASTTKIYVKQSAVDKYKTAWTKTGKHPVTEKGPFNEFIANIDYKIKDVNIAAEYATFAREFDVDLSDFASNEAPVYAFTAQTVAITAGTGDYGETQHHVRMYGLQLGAQKDGTTPAEGTYIPAETGVLLKVWGSKSQTPDGFYYRIGEYDIDNAVENVMKPVTRNPKPVNPTADNQSYYVMSKTAGVFRQVNPDLESDKTFNIAIHKAYFGFPTTSAKLMMDFSDDTTAIAVVEAESNASKGNGHYYNLSGQRIDKPTKGIYVQNGRKVVVK